MLRLANAGRTYDVVIKVAGEDVIVKLKSLSFEGRLEFMEKLSKAGTGIEGCRASNELFDDVIASIDGLLMKPSEVLASMEHLKDRMELIQAVLKWLSLDEQESKNSSSWLEQSTAPAPAKSAGTNAGEGADLA